MDHPLSRDLCKAADGQKLTVNGVAYVLRGKLGDGAVGLVRRVTRVRDDTELAIKFLAPDPKYVEESSFDDVAARFRREGERGQRLSHPALLKIHAYADNTSGECFAERCPKNPFIIMELVRGRTLESYIKTDEQLVRDGKRTFQLTPERLSLAVHVAEALKYLHKNKAVHRDVKPANIFIPADASTGTQARAKLGDFGIMKWGDFHSAMSTGILTATNQQGLGTMKYMSPEQAIEPKEVTTRSDMFSFGITLFELFTGQILASPHHVYQVVQARMSRGTAASRIMGMGIKISVPDAEVAELILDMHLRASGRPSIDSVHGRLVTEWERFTALEW